LGLTGTGFAQAKKNELLEKTNINGRIIVPKRSTCGMGLRVILPASLAVVSPHFNAVHP
jgi:hypothetical protein